MDFSGKGVARMTLLSIVAGAIGMFSDQGVFLVLLNFMNEYLANAIGIVVGTILSFLFNIAFIFKVKSHLFVRFALFFVTGIFGIFLSSAVIWLGTEILGLPIVPVRWFSLFFVALVQFFLNLFGAFGKRLAKNEA
ncbi:MAG: GtrA family protein [Streptococcaceae bacterium]|jgi:putative flippase GtrA|nr:GtrA family protein [Streptococcaceae bacterium]